MPELALAFLSVFLLLLSNWEGGVGWGGLAGTESDTGGLVISSSVSQTSAAGHQYRDLVIMGF